MPRGAAAVALGRLHARRANGGKNDLPCRCRLRTCVRGDVDEGAPDIRDGRSLKRLVVLLGGPEYLVADAVHDRFGKPKRPLCGGEDDVEVGSRTRANQLVVGIGFPLLLGGVKMHKGILLLPCLVADAVSDAENVDSRVALDNQTLGGALGGPSGDRTEGEGCPHIMP